MVYRLDRPRTLDGRLAGKECYICALSQKPLLLVDHHVLCRCRGGLAVGLIRPVAALCCAYD